MLREEEILTLTISAFICFLQVGIPQAPGGEKLSPDERITHTPIDSKTYITRWSRNQENERKLKDFAVRNEKKYEQPLTQDKANPVLLLRVINRIHKNNVVKL